MCQERPDRISKWRDHLISNKIKYQGKQILLGIESSTERKKEIDCCCCSEVQPCLTFCDPMECNTPVFPVLHYLLKFAQTQVHWISDAIQPSYPLSLLLLPSIFPTIRVFPNELAFCIRWPKCWSFSFSNSPSNEYSGLISLGLTGLIVLLSKGLLRVFSSTTIGKHQFFITQTSLWSNFHPYMTIGKTMALTWWIFVSKVMSLLFNTLSRLVIAFL